MRAGEINLAIPIGLMPVVLTPLPDRLSICVKPEDGLVVIVELATFSVLAHRTYEPLGRIA